ncbi:hypothetical protein [Pelomicrobium methylotrophicum]|uniref:Outer membrane protein beta-barrel domain-containing protein n=1 Tax=Pelomicrobium methylotrophicum TaxID=2602750 RepID=A0A5C7EVL9_9PROT|nr:hypothetical protein [Pelomicrobium methylotrophicum]TXF12186.1 hypothetical protein FR698_06500 [Pelomicrobium methylotrophicum]
MRKVMLIGAALLAASCLNPAFAEGLRLPGEQGPWGSTLAYPAFPPDTTFHRYGALGLNRPGLGLGRPPRLGAADDAAFAFDDENKSARLAPPWRFGSRAFWGNIDDGEIRLPFTYKSADGWLWTVAPSLGTFRDKGTGWGNLFSYGAVLSAAREVSAGRRIGLGVGVFDRRDRLSALPFIAVDWQFTDRLRLTNPVAAGPVGLELKYRISDAWEIGAGGGYRSARFRLDGGGLSPFGVGEERGVAAFLHLARSLGPRFSVDIYAGTLLGGEMRLENNAGAEFYYEELAPIPMFGFSLTGRF